MREGGEVTEVPDVIGLDADDASAIVRRAGLVPFGPEYTAEPTSGVVTAQRPIGTAGSERGAAVFLWTEGGRREAEEPVPAVPRESDMLDPA